MITARKILKMNRKEINENLDKIAEYLKVKKMNVDRLQKLNKKAYYNSLIMYNNVVSWLVGMGVDLGELDE